MIEFDYSKDDFYWALKLSSVKDKLGRGIWSCSECGESTIVVSDSEGFIMHMQSEFEQLHSHGNKPDLRVINKDGRVTIHHHINVEVDLPEIKRAEG